MSRLERVTGDARTDALVPVAARLVAATRDYDRELINQLIAATADVHGLIVVLAAMIPDDYSPGELVGWTTDPDEYNRLRTAGVDSLTASALVSRKDDAA